MINPPMKLLLAALFLFALISATQAAVLLQIDVTDPQFVIIQATGEAPGLDDSSYATTEGFFLKDFFSGNGNGTAGVALFSDLKATESTEYYSPYGTNYGLLSARDINIYSTNTAPQIFTTSSPAFTGLAVFDCIAFAAILPELGATGDIHLGDTLNGSVGPVIGQWQIVDGLVPEPSTFFLLGLGGLLLFCCLHKRPAI